MPPAWSSSSWVTTAAPRPDTPTAWWLEQDCVALADVQHGRAQRAGLERLLPIAARERIEGQHGAQPDQHGGSGERRTQAPKRPTESAPPADMANRQPDRRKEAEVGGCKRRSPGEADIELRPPRSREPVGHLFDVRGEEAGKPRHRHRRHTYLRDPGGEHAEPHDRSHCGKREQVGGQRRERDGLEVVCHERRGGQGRGKRHRSTVRERGA
jgi:hypothetical protein